MRKSIKAAAFGLGLLLLAPLLAACDNATATLDMFAVVVGNGKTDAKVKQVVYPGETVKYDETQENVWYIPANTRNYVVGKADAGVTPDRTEPAVGRTKEGTPVNVWLSSSWGVNQDYNVLTNDFWAFCLKYNCATSDPTKREDNSAPTKGWTNMLNENFGDAYNAAVRKVMPQFDDSVWKEQKDWDKVAAAISEEFPKQMALKTNYTVDLFCGGGNISSWNNTTPGADGTYTCGPITFTISAIEAQNSSQQEANSEAKAADEQLAANQKILDAAVAKYGSKERAGEVLGQLDVIQKCKDAGMTTCVITVGGQSVTVSTAK